MRSKSTIALAAILCGTTLVGISVAELIGIVPEFPLLMYNNQGVTDYDADEDLFAIDATPLAILFDQTGTPRTVDPTGVPLARFLQIRIQVDENGNLIGGDPITLGDTDLIIEGEVDVDGDSIPDYDGVLLTGAVLEFGFKDSGGSTDEYDFRFRVTGGSLAPLYEDSDIGMVVTSEQSDFEGDFGVDFSGEAKGVIGPIEPFCGDGVLDPGEECDDGNLDPGDGCSPTCEFEEPGDEGCTPGYWKQAHHFHAWAVYSPDDLFGTVFDVDITRDMSLLKALRQGGGREKALGRHAVAALLNASNPEVDYFYTEADVIAIVQDAFATGEFETAKDLLEWQNERGCPLGGRASRPGGGKG